MNKILLLCVGILIMTTIPFSTQEGNPTNKTNVKPTVKPVASTTSDAGLGPLPNALCLLIPAAILGFIHSRS